MAKAKVKSSKGKARARRADARSSQGGGSRGDKALSTPAAHQLVATDRLKWGMEDGTTVEVEAGGALPAGAERDPQLALLKRLGVVCTLEEWERPLLCAGPMMDGEGHRYHAGDVLPPNVRSWPTYRALVDQGRIRIATEEEARELHLQRRPERKSAR